MPKDTSTESEARTTDLIVHILAMLFTGLSVLSLSLLGVWLQGVLLAHRDLLSRVPWSQSPGSEQLIKNLGLHGHLHMVAIPPWFIWIFLLTYVVCRLKYKNDCLKFAVVFYSIAICIWMVVITGACLVGATLARDLFILTTEIVEEDPISFWLVPLISNLIPYVCLGIFILFVIWEWRKGRLFAKKS